jgi:two-component system OmpR family response regulator
MSDIILIVEDEVDLAQTCIRLLRRRGWQAVAVQTRAAGLGALRDRPALAIVDRQLPDGDGLDVLRAAADAGTPAIMVSGHDLADTQRRALDCGAAGFLGKPFGAQALLGLIDAILGPPPAAPVAPLPHRPLPS